MSRSSDLSLAWSYVPAAEAAILPGMTDGLLSFKGDTGDSEIARARSEYGLLRTDRLSKVAIGETSADCPDGLLRVRACQR